MRDLFPGYYKPKLDEEQLLREGIFVFDTNILLNFYRYSPMTREQLFRTVEVVKDRIWLPYQAAQEFQRRRLDIIRGERKAYEEAIKHFKGMEAEFQKLATKQRKGTTARLALDEAWLRCAADSQAAIEHLENCAQRTPPTSLDDPLRDRIDVLFEGKVGHPPEAEKDSAYRKEAQKRIAEKIPPGYMDAKSKDEAGAQGDCLLWLQTLDYIESQKKPLIFVSDDIKEDWYWEVDGQKVGPRAELTEEVRSRIGVDLVLSDSANFIKKISHFFLASETIQNVETAIEEAKQVQQEIEELNTPVYPSWFTPQTWLDAQPDAIKEFLTRLKEDEVPLSHDDRIRITLAGNYLRRAIKEELNKIPNIISSTPTELIRILRNVWDGVSEDERENIVSSCKWIQIIFDLQRDISSHSANVAIAAIQKKDSLLDNRTALIVHGLQETLEIIHPELKLQPSMFI